MSKAGERLIEGAKEALAVAKGEKPAARIHVNGHAYVPEASASAEIARLKGEAEEARQQAVAGLMALSHRDALQARVSALEAALRPFAKYLDAASFDLDNNGDPLPNELGMGWVYLTVGDFRAARSALQEGDRDA